MLYLLTFAIRLSFRFIGWFGPSGWRISDSGFIGWNQLVGLWSSFLCRFRTSRSLWHFTWPNWNRCIACFHLRSYQMVVRVALSVHSFDRCSCRPYRPIDFKLVTPISSHADRASNLLRFMCLGYPRIWVTAEAAAHSWLQTHLQWSSGSFYISSCHCSTKAAYRTCASFIRSRLLIWLLWIVLISIQDDFILVGPFGRYLTWWRLTMIWFN